jgi:hypothetical protein
MWTESLFNGLESTGVQRRQWSKSLIQFPKACLGTPTLPPRAFTVGETGVMALSQKVIIVNQPGASGSIVRLPPRMPRQIKRVSLTYADEAGPNVRLRANWTVRRGGSLWPFSEVRERLLNMLVVERVRFAFYRRSLCGR